MQTADSSVVNPLSTNPKKWSNSLKQFVANLLTNCLSVFDHFVELALKGLTKTVDLCAECFVERIKPVQVQ